MKPALLVVDMQEEFFSDERSRPTCESALEWVNPTVDLFREHGYPVVFIQDEEAGGGPETPGFGIHAGLHRKDSDPVVQKLYTNSFWDTELTATLKKMDVDYVVICGFAAGQCVTFTYNGARERGFGAVLLEHGVAGWHIDHVRFTHELCDGIGYDTLERMLPSLKV